MLLKPGDKPKKSSPPADGSGKILLVLCAVGAAALESILVAAYAQGKLSVWSLGLGHLALLGCLFLISWIHWKRDRGRRQWATFFLATSVLGPLGPIGFLFGAMLEAYFRLSASSFREWYESLFPPEEIDHPTKVFEEIRIQEEELSHQDVPAAFLDLLNYGSFKEKQSVISLITRYFKPAFAPALRAALNDESNAVRVQAATSMARIENDFLEKSVQLEKILKAGRQPEMVLALAQHYDNYAYTGILDSAREGENRRKALELYQIYLEFHPDNPKARLFVGRILLREGDYKEARTWLIESIANAPPTPELILWLAEADFRLGEWQRVERLLIEHQNLILSGHFPSRILDSLKLWNGRLVENEEAA